MMSRVVGIPNIYYASVGEYRISENTTVTILLLIIYLFPLSPVRLSPNVPNLQAFLALAFLPLALPFLT